MSLVVHSEIQKLKSVLRAHQADCKAVVKRKYSYTGVDITKTYSYFIWLKELMAAIGHRRRAAAERYEYTPGKYSNLLKGKRRRLIRSVLYNARVYAREVSASSFMIEDGKGNRRENINLPAGWTGEDCELFALSRDGSGAGDVGLVLSRSHHKSTQFGEIYLVDYYCAKKYENKQGLAYIAKGDTKLIRVNGGEKAAEKQCSKRFCNLFTAKMEAL